MSRYAYDDLCTVASIYLQRHKTDTENARITAEHLVKAERDGQKGHGLARLKSYAEQAECGKIDGYAEPIVHKLSPAAFRIDAAYGFAFPALAVALEALVQAAQQSVIAMAMVYNSHHCGALGLHVEALAEQGMLGLMMSNSPHAIAPWGGKDGVFGTNPIALAAPRENAPPLIIDASMSTTARGKILVAAEKNAPIAEGLALDADGKPTTDAHAALAGTMLPIGGAKGSALAMLVEILAAALGGAQLGFEASRFLDTQGGPPATGQLLMAIAPSPFSAGAFSERIEALIKAILQQENTRLPGDSRLKSRQTCAAKGIPLNPEFYQSLL